MVVNGKKYKNPELTLDTLFALENLGATLDDTKNRPINFLSCYVGLAMNTDMQGGKDALQEHLNGGGSLDELLKELTDVLDRSPIWNA